MVFYNPQECAAANFAKFKWPKFIQLSSVHGLIRYPSSKRSTSQELRTNYASLLDIIRKEKPAEVPALERVTIENVALYIAFENALQTHAKSREQYLRLIADAETYFAENYVVRRELAVDQADRLSSLRDIPIFGTLLGHASPKPTPKIVATYTIVDDAQKRIEADLKMRSMFQALERQLNACRTDAQASLDAYATFFMHDETLDALIVKLGPDLKERCWPLAEVRPLAESAQLQQYVLDYDNVAEQLRASRI